MRSMSIILAIAAAAWAFSPGPAAAQEALFRRGDSNQDGAFDQSDCIGILLFLFLGEGTPACADTADVDDTGSLDISDPIFGLTFLFLGGQTIPPPGAIECGADPTGDAIDCASYKASCGKPEGCTVGSLCEGGRYCFFQTGDCGEIARQGECRVVPENCQEIFEPVCGCDGRTYDNECFAAAAGVNVRHEGRCSAGQECKDNAGCPENFFCRKAEGACDANGICTERPDLCLDAIDPVCGCDGVTYGNECEANQAGVNIVHRGECKAPGGDCESTADCLEGFYCFREEGLCDGDGRPGQCRARPDACPGDLEPVCGCDGITYTNACDAARAGINIRHAGECKPVGDCDANGECGFGLFCAKAPGNCDGLGTCTPFPADCPDKPDPVCGCDNVTYSNACEAAAAGISVKSFGPCEGEGIR